MITFAVPVAGPSTSAHWSTPAFRAEVRVFVEAALGPVDLTQHKLRGWSTVLTAQCEEGLFWVKQNCPSQAFEAALLDALAQIVPDRVVPLRAVDRDRGLLLTPDQGDVHDSMTTDLGLWEVVVREWAELQREVAPYAATLEATGVDVLLPRDCPQLLDVRAEALHALAVADPRRLDDDGLAAVVAGRDRVREAVDVVGGLGLAPTLNHNDLHGGNVFATSAEVVRFFDLGDAMLTEPMAALLTPLNLLRQALECPPEDPRLWRVAEAWIEVWSDLAPAPALRRALPHALRLARLARHEGWLRITASLDEDELAEWGGAAAQLLVLAVGSPVVDHPRDR